MYEETKRSALVAGSVASDQTGRAGESPVRDVN